MKAAEDTSSPTALEQFRRDVAECLDRLPDKGLFLGLLVAWAALFHFLGNSTLGYFKTSSIFGWLRAIYITSADEGHIVLIPVVVLALFWWKRKTLLDGPKGVWWPALGLVVLALLLHLAGFIIQQTRLSIVAFFLGLYGLTGLVWGRHWLRNSFFPFFLFIFCIPGTAIAEPVTFQLRLFVAQIVTVISHGLGIGVIRDGTQLFNLQHTFGYDVAPACSGIRSLISLLALTTVYGFVIFRSPRKRLLMAIMAIPLAVLGNVTRLTFVIITAETMGQDAGAWVEQKFGFVTFAVAIGCVALLGHWLREPAPDAAPPPTNHRA